MGIIKNSEIMSMEEKGKVMIVQIAFIILVFLEAFVSSFYPTWNANCRENPKIIGIANSFAGGVFIAIALMHITPEEIEVWSELPENKGKDDLFPLPEMLVFIGYTIILIIDKVLFDTSALWAEAADGAQADPAARKLSDSLKNNLSNQEEVDP